MESGHVVEYIDRQKILCAVVLEVKKKRLRLLTENNREVNLSVGRLSHHGGMHLDLSTGRANMVNSLKTIAVRRGGLVNDIDIQELWEVLNSEQEWIDLGTMTEFCFPESPTVDHESAVVRAFFQDKLYFKFTPDQFFPNSEQKVEQIAARNREAQRKALIIEQGGGWLKRLAEHNDVNPSDSQTADFEEFKKILKSCYLFGKSGTDHALGKAMLEKAGIRDTDGLFPILVALEEFSENENVDIHRYAIPVVFSEKVLTAADKLVDSSADFSHDPRRRDLTHLPAMTIDGQSTQDFDDALSIESCGGYFQLGIHISDVAHFVTKGSLVDDVGAERGSSIYTPDQRIPMLPPNLAEGLCSLKAGELRPAASIMVKIDSMADVIDWEIVPSLIRVRDQLSYYDVNLMADDNRDIGILCNIAEIFRKKRLASGAVQINLPDINVWLDDEENVTVNRINRESPGRRLVAEIMIMANWLMARFLAEKNVPAIFRSQPDPRERLYAGEDGTLFQNCMQRRLLNRFILDTSAGAHSGLGLDAYVTATSPIRKYFDLVTQRQIRSVFGMEEPYSRQEIDRIIQMLEQPMSRVILIQRTRNRYWLLKYLETQIGKKEEAIVLTRRRNGYQILLKEYMLECDLSTSSGVALKPEDLIQVTLQQVNARRDTLAVFMG